MFSRTALGWTIVLAAFWLGLSGTVSAQAAVAGTLGALLVVGMNRRSLLSLRELPGMNWRGLAIWLHYGTRFLLELLKANVQVALLVLSPGLDVSPRVIKVPGRLRSDAARVILSNTITLTPGTLTIDVDDHSFTVHAITEEAARGVQGWIMERLLYRMEETSLARKGGPGGATG